MTAKRTLARRANMIAAVFMAAVAAGVLLWLVFAAPGYTEREREVRNENAAMEKDIAEIEAMNGSTGAIEKKIKDAEDRIRERYAGRSVTAETAADVINEISRNAGVESVGIDVGKEKELSPPGVFAPALYAAEVTILFEGTEKLGAGVIQGLENSPTADFEVTAFIYSTVQPEEDEEDTKQDAKQQPENMPQTGEWVITAKIYYYR